MRLFVAIDPPDSWRDSLAALVSDARRELPRASWVRPEVMHATLLFLGDVDDGALPEIDRRLAGAARSAAPFELRAGPPGTFPPRGRPRVLFAGLSPAAAVSALARTVEESLADMGFRSDHPESVPHLTLARVRDARGGGGWRAEDVERWRKLAETRLPASPWMVDSVRLVRSVLGPGGPTHTIHAGYRLGGEPR